MSANTHLLLAGRVEQRLRAVGAAIEPRAGRIERIVAGLASTDGVAAVIERARQAEIDLLVCNAGIGWWGNFLASPIAAARDTVSVNIIAVLELIHALLPRMIERARRASRRAAVIIVSSMAAYAQAPARIACYAASKIFVLPLVEALALEHRADAVDVLGLCPTYTHTAFFARAGLPEPRRAMTAEAVAREAMQELGQRSVQLCSLYHYPQGILRRLAVWNPALLESWRLARQLLRRLLRIWGAHAHIDATSACIPPAC